MRLHNIDDDLVRGPRMEDGRPRFEVVLGWQPETSQPGSFFGTIWDRTYPDDDPEGLIWEAGTLRELPLLSDLMEAVATVSAEIEENMGGKLFDWPFTPELVDQLVADQASDLESS